MGVGGGESLGDCGEEGEGLRMGRSGRRMVRSIEGISGLGLAME